MSWDLVRSNAKTFKQENRKVVSLGKEVSYRIIEVDDRRITIERLNGGDTAYLRKNAVIKAINKLREFSPISKGNLIHIVAEETLLVNLHPSIKFDEVKNQIIWVGAPEREIRRTDKPLSEQIASEINEASDDEIEKVRITVNKRSRQSKFRANLMEVYEGRCAITGTSVSQVLEAAHILPHSVTRSNHSTYGILLRSDLHCLFDDDLLLVEPEAPNVLKVRIHDKLRGTEYWTLNGVKLRKRKDGQAPNTTHLKKKSEQAGW
jgi:hypothetical protein